MSDSTEIAVIETAFEPELQEEISDLGKQINEISVQQKTLAAEARAVAEKMQAAKSTLLRARIDDGQFDLDSMDGKSYRALWESMHGVDQEMYIEAAGIVKAMNPRVYPAGTYVAETGQPIWDVALPKGEVEDGVVETVERVTQWIREGWEPESVHFGIMENSLAAFSILMFRIEANDEVVLGESSYGNLREVKRGTLREILQYIADHYWYGSSGFDEDEDDE